MIDEINLLKVEDGQASAAEATIEDEHPRVKKFSVTNPTMVNKSIKYNVEGADDEGDFNIVRRYREFNALAQVLRQRWPGCYVPCIPEKKFLNGKDEEFVEERRSLLDRFMKEIAKYDYIVFSKEFKLFSRGQGEVDKNLQTMAKQTPMVVLEKYRLNFQINEEQDDATLKVYKDRIMNFQAFLKQAIGIMEMQKKQVKNMMNIRDKQNKAQSELLSNLMKFEDVGIAYYSDADYNKRILTHSDKPDLKQRIDDQTARLKNPYREAYLWIKGELLEIQGMYDALLGREMVMKAQLAVEQKKRSDQTEMQKLSEGKTTLKSVFKSKSKKEESILNLKATIELADNEISDYRKLTNYLTVYHGQIAIPSFKLAKSRLYLRSLNNFCVKEISNAHLTATLYHGLLKESE